MIGREDIFYAFFAGIASFVTAFIIIFLVAPNKFQNDPSLLSISFIIVIEIIVFLFSFFMMRRHS
jgi:Na+/melibiose symporter-like transporter